ncbi:MAG: VCBS repeat-containing protein, partial [Gammaproteobacteria bacterium]
LAWKVARIADYGGDGKADMLIRKTSTGQLFLNEMDGNAKTGSNVGGLPTVWKVEVQ